MNLETKNSKGYLANIHLVFFTTAFPTVRRPMSAMQVNNVFKEVCEIAL